MSHRVIFSPKAETQLVKLHRDIGERSTPATGEQYAAAIIRYCLGFSTFPQRGTRRDDIRAGLRTIGYRHSATIAFEVTRDTVNILGVYYGGQDYEADLQDEDDGDEHD